MTDTLNAQRASTIAAWHDFTGTGWREQIDLAGFVRTNDAPDNAEPLADFVAGLGNVERVDVLPFHALAAPKYDALGLPFP